MKFEGGVHRVQRVPATESSGRIHTSAATVAVLPEAEEVEVDMNCGGSGKRKNNFYGKSANRIPLWAKHPEQYCHKIIRAFFQCQEEKEQFIQ